MNLKINWLIRNDKVELLENFLVKNDNFNGKKKVIQYLVDKNIAKANLKEGCEKADFISKEIKDSYLEKFKIYCFYLYFLSNLHTTHINQLKAK